MKKTILIFAFFMGLLITSSEFNKTNLNTSIGKPTPTMALEEIEQVIYENEQNGKYILLSFWSTTDGASRLAVNNYNNWINNNKPSNLCFLSVNFDKSEKLFQEIVKRDGLDEKLQFNVSGIQAKKIIKDYNLNEGYGSILIDPEGIIVAHNPSDVLLDKITNAS